MGSDVSIRSFRGLKRSTSSFDVVVVDAVVDVVVVVVVAAAVVAVIDFDGVLKPRKCLFPSLGEKIDPGFTFAQRPERQSIKLAAKFFGPVSKEADEPQLFSSSVLHLLLLAH